MLKFFFFYVVEVNCIYGFWLPNKTVRGEDDSESTEGEDRNLWGGANRTISCFMLNKKKTEKAKELHRLTSTPLTLMNIHGSGIEKVNSYTVNT